MSERSDRRWRVFVSAGIGLLYVLLAWRLWWLCDDAFISFRYAKNWVAGHGLRFNPAEVVPVEGYSNFLWVAVAAVVRLFRGEPCVWVPFVSLACGLVLLQRVHWTLGHRLGVAPLPAFLATLWLAALPPFALWASTGMETMPAALLLFLLFDRLVLRPVPAPLSAAAVALALSLIRIDGFAWVLMVIVLVVVFRLTRQERQLGRIALALAIVSIGFGLYFWWRLTYYQAVFPNPVYLKTRLGADVLVRGLRYLGHYLLSHPATSVGLIAVAVALRRPKRPLVLPLVAMALAPWGYALVVGGDWMPMGRFLLPSLAFLALLVGEALQAWPRRLGRLLPVAALVVVVIALLPAWNIHFVPRSVLASLKSTYSHRGYRTDAEWLRMRVFVWRKVGLALKRHSYEGDSIVVGAVGALGYYSELHVYDRLGLVNREVVEWARRQGPSMMLRSPGHDFKVSRSFFLDARPTFLDFVVIRGDDVGEQARQYGRRWRKLHDGKLWLDYAPELIPLDDQPVSGAPQVLLVLRRIEEPPEAQGGSTDETRASRAAAVWKAFFQRTLTLRRV
jgi:arabinofuranosyltransferase